MKFRCKTDGGINFILRILIQKYFSEYFIFTELCLSEMSILNNGAKISHCISNFSSQNRWPNVRKTGNHHLYRNLEMTTIILNTIPQKLNVVKFFKAFESILNYNFEGKRKNKTSCYMKINFLLHHLITYEQQLTSLF